jgi:hypothetical protein
MKALFMIAMGCSTLRSIGQSPSKEEGKLALRTAETGNRKKADSLSKDYYDHYLAKQPDSILFNKDNLTFVVGFPGVIRFGDRYFAAFYSRGAELEKQMGWMQGVTHIVVVWKITDKYINSRLYRDGKPLDKKPHWDRYAKAIRRHWGQSYVDAVMIPAEKQFYRQSERWTAYLDIIDGQLKQHPPKLDGHFLGGMVDDLWQVNGIAWDLFQHCNDTAALERAAALSELTINEARGFAAIDQYIDTHANLLYKLSRKVEAIKEEQQAADLGKGAEVYLSTLKKMRAGEPTWP